MNDKTLWQDAKLYKKKIIPLLSDKVNFLKTQPYLYCYKKGFYSDCF